MAGEGGGGRGGGGGEMESKGKSRETQSPRGISSLAFQFLLLIGFQLPLWIFIVNFVCFNVSDQSEFMLFKSNTVLGDVRSLLCGENLIILDTSTCPGAANVQRSLSYSSTYKYSHFKTECAAHSCGGGEDCPLSVVFKVTFECGCHAAAVHFHLSHPYPTDPFTNQTWARSSFCLQ